MDDGLDAAIDIMTQNRLSIVTAATRREISNTHRLNTRMRGKVKKVAEASMEMGSKPSTHLGAIL